MQIYVCKHRSRRGAMVLCTINTEDSQSNDVAPAAKFTE